MKAHIALVVVAAALAGCGSEPPGPKPATIAGLFEADGDGLRSAALLGVQLNSTDPFNAAIDYMALAEEDSITLFLYQALEDQHLSLRGERDAEVPIGPDPAAGENRDGNDFCMFSMFELHVPGDDYIARAEGQPRPMVETGYDREFRWSRQNFGGSSLIPATVGGSGNSAHYDGPVAAGEWVMILSGQSGVSMARYNDGENFDRVHLLADGAGRLVRIPNASFFCGNGFSRFGGTTTPFATVGGALATSGPYGTTSAFFAAEQPFPRALLENRGELGFLDESIPVGALSSEWRFAYQEGSASLEIEQWSGSALWLLAGMSLPVPAPGCPNHCPPG